MAANYRVFGATDPPTDKVPHGSFLAADAHINIASINRGLGSVGIDATGGINVQSNTDNDAYLQAPGTAAEVRVRQSSGADDYIDFRGYISGNDYVAHLNSNINVDAKVALVSITAVNRHITGTASIQMSSDNDIGISYNIDDGAAATDVFGIYHGSAATLVAEFDEAGAIAFTPVTNQNFGATTLGNGSITISSATSFSISGHDDGEITVDNSALTLSTTSGGNIIIDAEDDVIVDGTVVTVTATDGDLSLISEGELGGDVYLTNNKSSKDIFFTARASGNIPFNEAAPDNALVGFTATSIIGALNEVRAAVTLENLWDRTGTDLSPHTVGDSLLFTAATGITLTANDDVADVALTISATNTGTKNGQLVLDADGAVRVGVGVPGSATGAGDLYVKDVLEVDGVVHGYSFRCKNAASYGAEDTTNLGSFIPRSVAQTPNTSILSTGTLANSFVICEAADSAIDFANQQQSNPTLIFQNADAKSIYGRGYIAHDNDDFTFQSHRGGFSFEVPAQYAQGTLTLTGLPSPAETFNINGQACTAVAAAPGADEFEIGGTVAATVANIAAMILAGSETANVKAWVNDTDDAVVFEWKTAGVAGNNVVFTEALSNATIDGGGFLGGTHLGVVAYTPLHVLENGSVRVGTGVPGTATGAGDLYVTDNLEVDAISYFHTGGIYDDDAPLVLGVTGTGARLEYNSSQTADALMIGPPDASKVVVFADRADIFANYNYAHASQLNPTIFIQSANQSATEWIGLTHDQTDGAITTGAGMLRLKPATAVAVGTGVPAVAVGAGSLYTTTQIEAHGAIYTDSDIYISGRLKWGGGVTNIYRRSDDGFVIALDPTDGAGNRHMIITDQTNDAKDHDHDTLSANPTVFIHSVTDPDTNNTQWLSLAHNQTDAVKGIGAGSHVTNHEAPVELADDGTFNLPTSSAGFGVFMAGDGEELAKISWDSAGTVTLLDWSANVATADTDTKFCFISGANPVVVKNRLGAAKKIMFDYHYTTP